MKSCILKRGHSDWLSLSIRCLRRIVACGRNEQSEEVDFSLFGKIVPLNLLQYLVQKTSKRKCFEVYRSFNCCSSLSNDVNVSLYACCTHPLGGPLPHFSRVLYLEEVDAGGTIAPLPPPPVGSRTARGRAKTIIGSDATRRSLAAFL